MSRILLIGHPPPFLDPTAKVEAAHIRTWQFLAPLVEDGHRVWLCVDWPDASATPQLPSAWAYPMNICFVPLGRRVGWPRRLQRIHDSVGPDCIVAVNFDCCLYATKLRTRTPLWMDIYGDYLTIVQAACYRRSSNRGLATSVALLRQVLSRGDAFSACGGRQRDALVGELAMTGRLDARTFGYEFVHVVPAGAAPAMTAPSPPAGREQLAALGVPAASFVVLWCGGYNTWTDVETLFAGVEMAMRREPTIHYVSVGASTYDAPETVYQRFVTMAQRSAYRERFHLLGWRPWSEVARFYVESDVGLNVDGAHYETTYGTRTRLVEMIAAGLPVITSDGCELSHELAGHGAAATFAMGSATALSAHIVALAQDRRRCGDMRRQSLAYAREELTFSATAASVRNWVRKPQVAPDRVTLSRGEPIRRALHWARSRLRLGAWRVAGLPW